MTRDHHSKETPFRSFRMPSPEADRRLIAEAAKAGLTVSELIRRAVIAALADRETP